MIEVTEAAGCTGLTDGRRRTGAISSSSSSEIVIGEWESVVSSSSEITVVEWGLGGRTEETEAAGVTEATEAAGVTEGTEAAEVTGATDEEGACGAGATEADALGRSCSMKCV